MRLDVAKRIIQSELAHVEKSTEFDEIQFDFLGGEPFLEFNLIKEICEWTWKLGTRVPFLFSATTNGTVITEEMKQWLRSHKHCFEVVLSCDGLPATQDMNRSGSSTMIDLDFFREVYPEQRVKMTVAPETAKNFYQDVVWLSEKGLAVEPGFAYGVSWSDLQIFAYRRALFKLANYYMAHQGSIRQFERNLSDVFCESQHRFCGVGVQMITYDVDGLGYPCHMFTPFILGKSNINVALSADDSCLDNRCRKCDYKNLCKTCYGMNLIERSDVKKRTRQYCLLSRAEIDACVYYKGRLYEKRIKNGEAIPNDEIGEMRAILKLNKTLPKCLMD